MVAANFGLMTKQPMRMSHLFLRTLRDDPADEDVDSAKLLIRAGYVRKVAPGIFSWLPLGLRMLDHVESIIREELEPTGAQEVHMPALLPREPYERTHRWEEYGDNMFRLKDMHDADYLLAPTHEEMFTLMAKNMYSSYKDLPLFLYQIQTKYRDEARPRAGLIRGREFIMEDGYSFTVDEEGLKKQYELQRKAYKRIYNRLGVKYQIVHAFSGPMGGSVSEEFQAPLEIGEDTYAVSPAGNAWNVEALKTPVVPDVDFSKTPAPAEKPTPGSKTIATLVDQANKLYPRSDRPWQASDILKNVIVALKHPDGTTTLAAIGLPGDRDVDLKRVEAALSPAEVSEATAEQVAKYPYLVPGYIGPRVLGPQKADKDGNEEIPYYIDAHVAKGSAWLTGADKPETHVTDLVYGRDFEATGVIEAAQVREGDQSPDGSGALRFQRGVEIGQIFQLGLKYSKALDFTVLDQNGKPAIVWMGSYGIGVSRVLACIAEYHHDDKGLALPVEVAPYQVYVLTAGKKPEAEQESEKISQTLSDAGVDVLYDDRKASAGIKFKDSELLGMPVVVVVGRDFLSDGLVEVRNRATGESVKVDSSKVAQTVTDLLARLREEEDSQNGEDYDA